MNQSNSYISHLVVSLPNHFARKIAVLARPAVAVALFLAVQTNVPVALAAQSASSMAMDQSTTIQLLSSAHASHDGLAYTNRIWHG